jgi:hypothetical protein
MLFGLPCSQRRLIFMTKRPLWLVSASLFLSMGVASNRQPLERVIAATTTAPSSQPAAAADELATVVDWLHQKGDEGRCDRFAAKALGLGDAELDFKTRTFTSESPKMFHYAGVSPKGHDVVLSRQKLDRSQGVVWLTSRTGELRVTVLMTVSNNETSAEVVPNERFVKGFEAQKKFFVGLAAKGE